MATTPNRDLRYPLSSDHTRLWEHFLALAEDVDGLLVSGERIATDILTADSAAWATTEVAAQTVTAALVSGRIYRITWAGDLAITVAGDQSFLRIREDSISGTVLRLQRYRANSVDNYPYRTEVEYTAVATGNKTFVFGGIRESGTGLGRIEASASAQSYFYVDYIRG